MPTLALLCVFVGFRLGVSPDDFTAGVYNPAFDLFPARVWGAALLFVGLSALIWREAWSAGALVGVTLVWGLYLAYSVFTGDSESPVAGAPWIAFSLATLLGVKMKGLRGVR